MASPLFDSLHLKLSRSLEDVVSSAATDGLEVSSARRTDYLNEANRFIQTTVWKLGTDVCGKFLSGLFKTQSFSWSSSGVSLESDFAYWIAAQKDGGTANANVMLRWVDPSRKTQLDSRDDLTESNCFTILGGKIYGYTKNIVLSTGTGKLVYLQNDQMTSAGNTTDIAIDSIWHDVMVYIAESFAREKKLEIKPEDGEVQRLTFVKRVIA